MAPPGHTSNSSFALASSTMTSLGSEDSNSNFPGINFRFDDLWTDDGAVGVVLLTVVVILLLMLLLIFYNIFHLCKCCHPYPSSPAKRNDGRDLRKRRTSKGQGSRRSSVASPPVKAFLTPPADPPAIQLTPAAANQKTECRVKTPPPSFLFGSTPSTVGY